MNMGAGALANLVGRIADLRQTLATDDGTVTVPELAAALEVRPSTVRVVLIDEGLYHDPDAVGARTVTRGRPPGRWRIERALDALESHYRRRLEEMRSAGETEAE